MATVRRVRRIIRKIDPWTALKVSVVFWAVIALAGVLGLVIFWSVLDRSGLPDRLTAFLVEVTLIDEGTQPFANVEQLLRVVVFGAVSGWVLATGTTVAFAVTYNLVSDVVGGLEVVVLEETYNPVVGSVQVGSPPADFRTDNGAGRPPLTLAPAEPIEVSPEHADIPTEETSVVSTST